MLLDELRNKGAKKLSLRPANAYKGRKYNKLSLRKYQFTIKGLSNDVHYHNRKLFFSKCFFIKRMPTSALSFVRFTTPTYPRLTKPKIH